MNSLARPGVGSNGVALGSALESAFQGMQESGGRMIVMQSQAATMGKGVLPVDRESTGKYGTDKEVEMYVTSEFQDIYWSFCFYPPLCAFWK